MQRRKRLVSGRHPEQLETRTLLSTITVTTLEDSLAEDGQVSLREALIAANEDRSVDGSVSGSGQDVVKFSTELAGGTVRLELGQLLVNRSVVIDGPADRVTIDAQGQSRIFEFGEISAGRIQDLRLINGKADLGGAVLSNAKSVKLVRSHFVNNEATSSGGALYAVQRGATKVRINGSRFEGNVSDGVAAVEVLTHNTTIASSTFVSNSGNQIVRMPGFRREVTNSRFLQNDSGTGGVLDGLYVQSYKSYESPDFAPMVVTGSEFRGNTGARVVTYAYSVTDSLFVANSPHEYVVRMDDYIDFNGSGTSYSLLDSSKFRRNIAPRIVYASSPCFPGNHNATEPKFSAVRTTNSEFTDNTGTVIDATECGGVDLQDSSIAENTGTALEGYKIVVTRSSILNNDGLGIHGSRTSSELSDNGIEVRDSTIAGNTQGGILDETDLGSSIISTTVSRNGVFALKNVDEITDSTIFGNRPDEGVAAVSAAGTIRNSIIAGNIATTGVHYDLDSADNVSHSLVGVNRGNNLPEAPPGSPDASGNLIGTINAPIDPQIGALGDNGGATLTNALSPNSPALNAGDSDAEFDQVGRSRSIGGSPDMGAFEFDSAVRHSPDIALLGGNVSESADQFVVMVGVSDLPAPGETVTATIDVTTKSGKRHAVEGEHFAAFSPTTVTFDADGPTSYPITIDLTSADNVAGYDKQFTVEITSTTGDVRSVGAPVIGTIIDDDTATVVVNGSRRVSESDPFFELTLRLNRPTEVPFELTAKTVAETARRGDDYTYTREVFPFSGGVEDRHTIRIPVVDDSAPELDETFRLLLSSVGTIDELLVAPTRSLTIVNDEFGMNLKDRQLFVVGAPTRNRILVDNQGDMFDVTLNDNTQSFPFDEVDSLWIRTFGGNDKIELDTAASLPPARIEAGEGNDSVQAGRGDDTIFGGPGDDTLRGSDGDDWIRGESGNDTLVGNNNRDTLIGDTGDDLIRGGEGVDLLRGGGGRDTIEGGFQPDTIYGDSGNDTLKGDGGSDVIYGGTGRDLLFGSWGNDQLYGGLHDDKLNGGDDTDWLFGGYGYDTLSGGADRDSLVDPTALSLGGAGDDTITGKFPDSDCWTPPPVCFTDEIDPTHAHGLTADGGPGRDKLTGSNGNDQLAGGDDNDEISGGEGDDTLWGNAAEDTLTGDAGNDRVFGGGGNDLLWGSNGDDTLIGGQGHDALLGGTDDDSLLGQSGRDLLFAGPGGDTLNGGNGQDMLNGSRLETVLAPSLSWIVRRLWLGSDSPIDDVTKDLDDRRATSDWRLQDDSIDVFEIDPGNDWLQVDSDLDDFTIEPDEPWIELSD